jgi:Protein of unknown function (DUF2721)
LDITLSQAMELTLSTPALLFPTVSLLYIGYTNRFLAIANLIRNLIKRYEDDNDDLVLLQIANLRRRLMMIRNMQFFGIMALLLCMISMIFIYTGHQPEAKIAFAGSLLLLTTSLVFSLREIQFSIRAIDIDLLGLEKLIRAKQDQ